MRRIIIATCLLFATCHLLFGQKMVTQLDANSSVDWTRQVLVATGSSGRLLHSRDRTERIEALERAKSVATQHLLKALEKLPLTASGTILQRIENNSTLARRVRRFVQQFTVTDTRPMSDLSVEVDVELPLLDGLSALFIPDVTGRGPLRLDDVPRSPLSLLPWPECRAVPEGVQLVIPSQGLVSYEGNPYTGLIIDASGLDAKQALLPEIKDIDGRQVYGLNYVDREIATQLGVVAYRGNLAQAMKDTRTGRVPLVICGTGVSGSLKSDIVVSENDAVLIHAAAKTQNFLKKCKVIIVID